LPELASRPGYRLWAWLGVPVRWIALGVALTCVAFVCAAVISVQPLFALAVPMVLASAVVAIRYPAAAIVVVFALTGVNGSLRAFTGAPVGAIIDLILGSLWVGAIWRFLSGGRSRPYWLWPGVVAVGLYLAVTAASVFAAPSVSFGVAAFHISGWYVLVFLLIAYGGWKPGTQERMARGIVVVALLVGAYATLRWFIGPASSERELADQTTGIYNIVEGKLRLVGSFTSGHELAAWCALAIPFCLAMGLGFRGRWRLLAAAACGTCAIGLFGSSGRIGAVATVVGLAVVLGLVQFGRAYRTLRVPVTVAGLVAIAALGVTAFGLTVQTSGPGTERYTVLLHPDRDVAYRTRQYKWRGALKDADRHPFGDGLGTAGRIQVERGRFSTVGSENVENSYLKVAVEQGFAVMGLFVVSVLLLLAGLIRRTVASQRLVASTLGIGAVGALTAYLVLLTSALYIEGLTALAAWIMVGVGVSQFAALEERPERAREHERDALPAVRSPAPAAG
jgi:hypothetical protein